MTMTEVSQNKTIMENLEKDRRCLICGGPSRYFHMGIDACRACTIFYRRATSRKRQHVCRSGTNKCATDKNEQFSCKKCRLDRINDVLKRSKTPSSTIPKEYQTKDDDDYNTSECPSSSITPLSCTSLPSTSGTSHGSGLITRIMNSYSLLNTIRRASELSIRPTIENAQVIGSRSISLIPATYELLNNTTRILVSSLFDYGAAAYPEFDDLSIDDKWLLVKNFYPYFVSLDSGSRSHKLFPERLTLCFTGYGSYVDVDTLDIFWEDCPSQQNLEEANRLLESYLTIEIRPYRVLYRDCNPTDEELSVLMGLSFWNIDLSDAGEELYCLSLKYRHLLIEELRQSYKASNVHENFAERFGNLFMLIPAIQSSFTSMPSKLEHCRLIDVFDENNMFFQVNNRL